MDPYNRCSQCTDWFGKTTRTSLFRDGRRHIVNVCYRCEKRDNILKKAAEDAYYFYRLVRNSCENAVVGSKLASILAEAEQLAEDELGKAEIQQTLNSKEGG